MNKYFYPLIENPYRKSDINEALKVLKSRRLTIGPITDKFQNSFTKKLGSNFSLMVNSGSSANLLALQCLINPYRKKRLKPGDEVLIPSLCWSTSLWPIIQSGLKPKFVDIDLDSLNINLNDLKKKISKKTKAILIVHVLGNCVDMSELMRIVKKHNLILIEDTCESLGTKYKNKYLGTFGDFSSFSFYSSHQISSGEGGMICCKNNDDHEIIKSLRAHGWSRGLKNEKKIAAANKHLDSRFIFYNSGFNLRSTDIAASIGLNQFKDIDQFIKKRSINRDKILKIFKKKIKMMKYLSFIDANNHVKASWFGIPILLSKKINRNKFLKKIEKLGVETRPIISGNFLKQPSIKKYKLNKKSNFKNSDIVNNHGFFIGLPTSTISDKNIKKLVGAFEKSL
ncbi:aminotransferase class I/II-fold pyridoxal phosphate-dependent enzyme [Pelagibacteraceae bacterium]|jgi:CDP-6-deoxy-D-xylo-4-hexulose-3-dehydrase|nr:aminotransferase class I/II-fold pyridoxal phosphate-dependent enzyme [Candidatus Pelagibacter bacterium]MDC1125271.1 aminotransferase class I/II-fold pyridoxal phosphate-dependent enzyme [Pelagibacteraceae bacterium]